MRAQLLHTVQWAVVQLTRAMWLTLQSDPDVLDGPGQDTVGHTGEGTRRGVLWVGETSRGGGVAGLEVASGGVEGAELDGDASADADEGREGTLVEGQGTFAGVDGCGGVEG